MAANPMQKLQFEHNDNSRGGAGDYETKLLDTTIEKITSLLRIGFGKNFKTVSVRVSNVAFLSLSKL